MNEFHGLMTAQHFIGRGGVDFAREILAAGLGEDRAGDILSRLNVVYTEVPFASLRNADVRQLVTFLKDEHAQIIALVLAHLTAAQSAEVLSGFAPEQQAEVAHRIAMMDRTSPEMVRLVEEELGRRMGSLLAHQDMTTVGGVETLVEIINRSPRPTERSILEWLDNVDPELAEQVRSQMFVFEDIVTIDDRSLQQVLREVEANDLATALKGVRPDVRDKVVRNLSERAAENLNEEIELLGPVRTRTVEEAQAKVVGIIRTLEESGVLTLTRGQDDEFVACGDRLGVPPMTAREGVLLRGSGAERATPYREQSRIQRAQQQEQARSGGRRSAAPPTCPSPPAAGRPSASATSTPRSWHGCVEHAHAEGFAAGHAEGMTAAASVVAEAERAAAERLAEVQARWERRVASATAALGAAAARFDDAAHAGRRGDPRDDHRHGPHPGRGPARPGAGAGRLPRARRHPPGADAVPVRRAGRRPRAPRRPRRGPRRGAGGAPRHRPGRRRPHDRADRRGRRHRLAADRRPAAGRPRAGPGGARHMTLSPALLDPRPAPPPGRR